MKKPKVSICIPTYKRPELLQRTLDSIRLQSFKDYEIIICDDTASDDIKHICEINQDLNCIFIKNEILLGSPENWNSTLRQARGDYIKILHHDDWFSDSSSLQKFVDALNNNPDISFCFSNCYACDVKGNILWTHASSDRQIQDIIDFPEGLLLANNIGAPSTTFFRSSEKIFFDTALIWLVDVDYYIRFLQKHKFIHLKDALVCITSTDPFQITHSNISSRIEITEYLILYERYKNKISLIDFQNHFEKILFKNGIYTVEQVKELLNDSKYLDIHINLFNALKYATKMILSKNELKKRLPTFLYKNIFSELTLMLFKKIRYRIQFRKFKLLDQDKRFELSWRNKYPCYNDNTPSSSFDRHYLYHTAWAARTLKKNSTQHHVDFSSDLQFIAIVSAFINIDFYDIRPAQISLSGLKTRPADLLKLPFENDSLQSVSCMHVIEHIGLGRYGDSLNPKGDLEAIKELKRVVAIGGTLLIVVPIGKQKIMFNAHRIYSYNSFLGLFKEFELLDYALIPDSPDAGDLIIDAPEAVSNKQVYGCGCFHFKKTTSVFL